MIVSQKQLYGLHGTAPLPRMPSSNVEGFIIPSVYASTENCSSFGIKFVSTLYQPDSNSWNGFFFEKTNSTLGAFQIAFNISEFSNPLFEQKPVCSTDYNRSYDIQWGFRSIFDMHHYPNWGMDFFMKKSFMPYTQLFRQRSKAGVSGGLDCLTPWGVGTLQSLGEGFSVDWLFRKRAVEVGIGYYKQSYKSYPEPIQGTGIVVRYTKNSLTYGIKWSIDHLNGHQCFLTIKDSPVLSNDRSLNFLLSDPQPTVAPTRFNNPAVHSIDKHVDKSELIQRFANQLIQASDLTMDLNPEEARLIEKYAPFFPRFSVFDSFSDFIERKKFMSLDVPRIMETNTLEGFQDIQGAAQFIRWLDYRKTIDPSTSRLQHWQDIPISAKQEIVFARGNFMSLLKLVLPLNEEQRSKLCTFFLGNQSGFDPTDFSFIALPRHHEIFIGRSFSTEDWPAETDEFSHQQQVRLFYKLIVLQTALSLEPIAYADLPERSVISALYETCASKLQRAQQIAQTAKETLDSSAERYQPLAEFCA